MKKGICLILCILCIEGFIYKAIKKKVNYPTMNGIYVHILDHDIFGVGLSSKHDSLGMKNADGSSLEEEYLLLSNELEDEEEFTLSLYDQSNHVLIEHKDHYDNDIVVYQVADHMLILE